MYLFIVVADTEVTTQTHLQLDAFDKVLEPKKLVLLKRGRDFTPDFGDLFVKNSKAQIAFLKSLLPEESVRQPLIVVALLKTRILRVQQQDWDGSNYDILETVRVAC